MHLAQSSTGPVSSQLSLFPQPPQRGQILQKVTQLRCPPLSPNTNRVASPLTRTGFRQECRPRVARRVSVCAVWGRPSSPDDESIDPTVPRIWNRSRPRSSYISDVALRSRHGRISSQASSVSAGRRGRTRRAGVCGSEGPFRRVPLRDPTAPPPGCKASTGWAPPLGAGVSLPTRRRCVVGGRGPRRSSAPAARPVARSSRRRWACHAARLRRHPTVAQSRLVALAYVDQANEPCRSAASEVSRTAIKSCVAPPPSQPRVPGRLFRSTASRPASGDHAS